MTASNSGNELFGTPLKTLTTATVVTDEGRYEDSKVQIYGKWTRIFTSADEQREEIWTPNERVREVRL